MPLTQNLRGCERVYPLASKTERPKLRAVPMARPISIMCAPTPNVDGRPTRKIPTAPRKRAVQHYGSMSDFTSAEEEFKASESRMQRRTDTLMSSLIPYHDKHGNVVRGAWLKREEVEV